MYSLILQLPILSSCIPFVGSDLLSWSDIDVGTIVVLFVDHDCWRKGERR
jgi:hypothetical protein